MSATTKYSKYSSRARRDHQNTQLSVFKNRMKRVIVSLDKRRKFNATALPASLGIQSIIIGSPYHEKEEEKVLIEGGRTAQLRSHDYETAGMVERKLSRTTKLEPLTSPAIANHSRDKELNDQFREADLDQIMSGKGRHTNVSTESKPKGAESKVPEIEIESKYDNKTTQNLCDLMNQANKRIFIPIKKIQEDESEYETKIFKEEPHPPMNHEGTIVFSKQGFITVGKGRNQPSDYISHDNFVLEGINKQIF